MRYHTSIRWISIAGLGLALLLSAPASRAADVQIACVSDGQAVVNVSAPSGVAPGELNLPVTVMVTSDVPLDGLQFSFDADDSTPDTSADNLFVLMTAVDLSNSDWPADSYVTTADHSAAPDRSFASNAEIFFIGDTSTVDPGEHTLGSYRINNTQPLLAGHTYRIYAGSHPPPLVYLNTPDSGQPHVVPLTIRIIPDVSADFDQDGDVDADDFTSFAACFSGPAIQPTTGCNDKDLDSDGDVDQSDFAIAQRCYSGKDHLASSNCAN